MFKFQDINAGYIDYSDEELGGDALDSDNDNIDDDNDIGLNDDDNDNDNHDEVKERFSNDRQIPTSSTHKQQEKTQQRLSSQSLAEMKRLADMITTFKLEQKSFKQKTQEELETKKLNELKQKRQTAWDVKVYSEDLKRASHDTTTTMTTIPSYSNSNNSDLDNSITMNDLLPGVVEKYEKVKSINYRYTLCLLLSMCACLHMLFYVKALSTNCLILTLLSLLFFYLNKYIYF